ncbi:MAG: hypothetical protein JSW61_14190 [Candidatus Thorarchaeota archaeon]|nr:MAG: hypothetical protein JSW61_14190 [Candidatus Thorarchaeota archaeon]
MTEIPMPSDYGAQPPPAEKKGFCSKVCEASCVALAACIICVLAIFIIIMIALGFFFF